MLYICTILKRIFILYFTMCFAYANAQVSDDFSDGNLSSNPEWLGELAKFTIENERLRSNSNTSDDAFYISTAFSGGLEGQWELNLELLFSTSSRNLVQFVLMSDSQNLFQSQNGYYIEIGGTKDKVTFNQIEDGVTTELFSSMDGTISGGSSRTHLKVIRDKDSIFTLFVDYDGGDNFVLEGAFKNGDIMTSNYTGVKIEQSTSSFFEKHYMDDFYTGPIVLDLDPPTLIGFAQVDLQTLDLQFNEALDSASVLQTVNFVLDKSIGNPISVEFIDVNSKKDVRLKFTPLGNPEVYTLTVKQVKDVALNALDTSLSFVSVIPVEVKSNKLLITELFPVTEPSVSLPQGEFIELYNHGQDPIDLGEYKIADNAGYKNLSDHILLQGEYIILCAQEDSADYAAYGTVMALPSLPSLNNSSDRIQVLKENGEVIHEVVYSYTILPAEKMNGWTYEMIDPDNPCHFYGNWAASEDNSGGTPGRRNSVYGLNEDVAKPILHTVYPNSSNSLELYFSESLDRISALDVSNYYLINNNEWSDSVFGTEELNKVLVQFKSNFVDGEKYYLEVRNTEDCVGNTMQVDTVAFGLAQEIEVGDIVFNEILYEPFTNGAEYLELFNTSNKYLDLKSLKLGVKEDTVFSKVDFVSKNGYLLAPQSFVVITSDKSGVIPFYSTVDSTVFYETNAVPSLVSAGMELVILNVQNEEIDAVQYSPKWHYEVVDDTKGVSLERIKIGLANTKSNWTSAAKSSGFGTPGLKNSQSLEDQIKSDKIGLEYKSFSPNQDGFRDVLLINYTMDQSNATANVFVFNSNGALVTQIANNETLSHTGSIAWKGETENGTQAQTGIYIILFEYFYPDGKVKREKLSCSLVLE